MKTELDTRFGKHVIAANTAPLPKRILDTLKGPIPSIFSSSLYIINQKPMIPGTHFHCIPT